MSAQYSIYCDESCHLESDSQKTMVLGSIWCNSNDTKEANKRIREIKAQHGLSSDFEIKWTKVSPAKIDFYLAVIDYFFDNDALNFRSVVIPDKSILDHTKFDQSHDEWYYKMYFNLIKVILEPTSSYDIYIDIKDTRGGKKIESLHKVLSNQMYDFQRTIIHKIQLVHSHEISLLQIADLISGAVMYENRGEKNSVAKTQLVERVKERSGLTLDKNTLYKANKFNLFVWDGQGSES